MTIAKGRRRRFIHDAVQGADGKWRRWCPRRKAWVKARGVTPQTPGATSGVTPDRGR